jgi:hypothetical protein
MQECELEVDYLQNPDEMDGVLYEDIKDKLNNKEEIENILFATRVVFMKKSELIEFMHKLMQFGYEDIALDYVEDLYDKAGIVDWAELKQYENSNRQ